MQRTAIRRIRLHTGPGDQPTTRDQYHGPIRWGCWASEHSTHSTAQQWPSGNNYAVRMEWNGEVGLTVDCPVSTNWLSLTEW